MANMRENLIQKHSGEFMKGKPEMFPKFNSQADHKTVIIHE